MMETHTENVAGPETGFPGGKLGWVLFAACLAALAAIYVQSLGFSTVNYDDVLVYGRDWLRLRDLSHGGLERIFRLSEGGAYQPIRHLAFALVYYFQGTRPFGYHLFNFVFYALNTGAAFILFRRLLGLAGGFRNNRERDLWAWAGTLWFAVHPVHVEAVAWMVSNKELLSGLFYFLSLYSYIRSRERAFSWLWYSLSLLCLVLGLLSKPSVAALPLVVAAFELLFRPPGGRRGLMQYLPAIPFVLPVVLTAVYYVFFSTTFTGRLLQDSLRVHVFTLSAVLAKYLKIMFLPVNLCNSYPPPFFFGQYDYRLGLYLLADIGLLAALALALRRGHRGIAFGLLFFLLNLLPVSGILPISIFMADRYLYIPSFGLILSGTLLAANLYTRVRDDARLGRTLVTALAVGALCLTLIAAGRCRVWRDGESLWLDAVHTYPNYQFNYYALGSTYMRMHHDDKALEAFRAVNRFKEHLRTTLYMGQIYTREGDSTAAARCYRRVTELYDEDVGHPEILAEAWYRLGGIDSLVALATREGGDPDIQLSVGSEADSLFEHGEWQYAARLYSALPTAALSVERLERLAAGLYSSGRLSGALQIFRRLSDSASTPSATALNNVGVVLEAMDSLAAAEAEYRRALGLNARYTDALFNLGNVLRKTGRAQEALALYRQVAELEGAGPDLDLAIGQAWLSLGRNKESIAAFERVLAVRPESAPALLASADALWALGQKKAALARYEKYHNLTDSLPAYVLPRTGHAAGPTAKN